MSSNEFYKIRENFGYRKDRLEHNTIFIPSKEGLGSITFDFGTNADRNAMPNKGKEVAKELALKHVKVNPSQYRHVGDNNKVFDIGPPNSSGHSGNDIRWFNKSMDMAEGKILNSASLKYGERGEEAYHIVLK